MTAKAQLRLIKKITAGKPFIKASMVLNVLEHAQRVVNRRRAEQTSLALEHELFMCEARRCKKILKEL
jgi:hypothetical protein